MLDIAFFNDVPIFISSIVSYQGTIDKEVITAVIHFGLNSVGSFDDAMLVTMTVFSILQPTSGVFTKVSDTRLAAAISAGLLELCIDFVLRYGEHPDPHPDEEDYMITNLWHLASSAHVTVLHKRSFKAIKGRQSQVQKALSDVGVTGRTTYSPGEDQVERSSVASTPANTFMIGWENKYPGRNVRCSQIIQTVQSAMYISTTSCCQCLEVINSAVKRCSKCQRTAYVSASCFSVCYFAVYQIHSIICMMCWGSKCSRGCQIEHWKTGGHKLDCPQMAMVNTLTVKGDRKKDIEKAYELESNIIVACNKLVLENNSRILELATHQKFDILDCIVLVELCHQLPFVKVKLATDSMLKEVDIERERFDLNKSNGALQCVYKSYVFNGEAGSRSSSHEWPITNLVQTFPDSLGPHGSWKKAQAEVEVTQSTPNPLLAALKLLGVWNQAQTNESDENDDDIN